MMNHCPKTCGLCRLLEGIRAAKEAEKDVQLPSAEDLKGIVAGVAKLQKLYDLPIDLMVSGTIHDFHTSVELSTWDCLQIGQYFIDENIFSNAWLWFNHIFNTSTDLDVKEYVRSQLEFIKNSHDTTWRHDESYFPSLLSQSPYQSPLRGLFSLSCTKASSVMLHHIPPSTSADFSCKLTTRGNPFFILQLIKQETVSEDPEIILFHDVISDSEIETLKRLARDNLRRDVKPNRRSEHAVLDRNDAVVKAVERRASMLSGLKMADPTETDPEALKIRNYGAYQ
ncbi:prolyl 4-hydroxylase subunit alpha-3-like [Macrobrachium rosenbergii]|uniref:prolyl 4-hydroxylase subunit alpha-3-like n=1 Tax=Macrobrachium rosenbergii TaxID=79674 RepID=UPI0034D71645